MIDGIVGVVYWSMSRFSQPMERFARREAPDRVALGFIGLICMIWAGIYGFISPANFGMGARFQLQILPFILMGCAILLDRWIRKDSSSEVL